MVERERPDRTIDRRKYLAGVSAATATGLAGCLGGNSPLGGGSGWNNTLEVLHGWAGGDGAAAIEAFIEAFKEEYPDMETNFQAVGASANVNLNATILRRMVNNNPMSAFANWPGKNLERYRGHLMDLEADVWDAAGYKDNMQQRAIELCTFNDKMPAVPLGSHRMNNLFYNVSAFEEAGIDAASLDSVDAMMSAFDTLKNDTDYVPMGQAMVAPWTVLQLWAQVLQSQAGVQAYMDFIQGNGDRAAIVESLKVVRDIQKNYIQDGASSMSFTDVGGSMINGEIATMHQGNWLAGQFRSDDAFNYQEHWDWIPFPGTEGSYGYHIDAMVAPGNNPSKDETIAYQKFVGTKKAQIAFNNLKGSVPLRTDINSDELEPFIGMTYEDLTSSDSYPPTLAHGLAVTPERMGACKTAMSNNMMGPYKIEQAADALLDAVSG